MAVLSDREIEKELGKIFGDTADPNRIQAAKYSLTLGERFLILPDGKHYGKDHTCSKRFSLKPGQTALLSTREELVMPIDMMGLLGPTFEIVDNGVLFLGGSMVDPGFGLKREDDDWVRHPEPLSFHIANVGSTSLELRPGRDPIASLAFIKLHNPHPSRREFPAKFEVDTARRLRVEEFESDMLSADPPDRTMGLVEDISDIRQRVDKFEASTFQVVLFGVIVLAVTLFAAMVALLSSGTAQQIELSLRWYEVLIGIGSFIAIPAGLVGIFYLWVCATVKRRESLVAERRRKQREKKR